MQHHYIGHRQRLKDRLLGSTHESLSDYEILEMFLFLSIPRRDVKPLAKHLIKEFRGLRGVINATKDKLLAIDGVTQNVCATIYLLREMVSNILRQNIMNRDVINSWDALTEYLTVTMGESKTERVRILYLNKKNCLISDELQTVGTVDQVPLYPREIVKKALFHEASAIIMVHNHPSGNPSPSKVDIELTNTVVKACESIGVKVHDHVIVASNEFYSFRTNRLI